MRPNQGKTVLLPTAAAAALLPALLFFAPAARATIKLKHYKDVATDHADFSAYSSDVVAAFSVKETFQDVRDELKKVKLNDKETLHYDADQSSTADGMVSLFFKSKKSDACANFIVPETGDSGINGVFTDKSGVQWAVVDHDHNKGDLAVLQISGDGGGGEVKDGPLYDDMDAWVTKSNRDGAADRNLDYEVSNRLRGRDIRAALQRAEDEPTTVSDISIKFYYSSNATEWSGDMDDMVNNIRKIMDITNEGFANSGVLINLELLCVEQLEVEDRKNDNNGDLIEAFFDAFNRKENNLLDTADVSILLVKGIDGDDADKVSVVAYLDNVDRAFGVVRMDNAMYHYGVGRALGHIFGAQVNDEALNPDWDPIPYSYGKGYLINNKKSTIMAQMQGTRVNYYSGMDTFDNDGDATGNANADNVRLFNEHRFMYGLVGDESTDCVLDPAYTATTTTPVMTTPSTCEDLDDSDVCSIREGLGACAEDHALYDSVSMRCRQTCGICS